MSSTPTIQEIDKSIYLGTTDRIARPRLDDDRVYYDAAEFRRSGVYARF